MQNQEKFFFKGHRSTFCIKMPFGIGHPHLHIKCSLHVCGRVQGSQVFKRNSIISIHSKVIAFLVISLSPWSPCRPCVIISSSPHHPHSPQKVPMWSPGCGLRGLHPMLSPWSPRHPRGPHIITVVPMSSAHHLEGPHIIPNPPDTHSTHP